LYGNDSSIDGFSFEIRTGSTTATLNNIISKNHTTADIKGSPGATITITDTMYSINSGFTLGSNTITDNADFIDVLNDNYNINPTSAAWKAGNGNESMGFANKLLLIAGNDTTTNGITFDGGGWYGSAITSNSTVTGKTLKWNTIKNFKGNSVEEYGAGGTASIIQNNNLNNNANGIGIVSTGNTITNNILYSNSNLAFYFKNRPNTIKNNSFYLNGTHFEVGTGGGGFVLTNSIFSESVSGNDIVSAVSVTVTNCCITSNSSDSVITSSSTNTTNTPLYINTNTGSEDFNIKTIEGGYSFDSPCKDAGDDGNDMGAYSISRDIASFSWKKFLFNFNPRTMNEAYNPIKPSSIIDALGSKMNYAASHKRVFPFIWANNSATNEEQLYKIRYISSLIPTRENELTEDQCYMLFHPLPTGYIKSSSGTISGTTLTDSTTTMNEDQFKGFHLGIKFLEVSSAVIDATAKTATKTGAFTGTDYTGYFIYINTNYYYIASNTDNALTLNDPDSTLQDETIDIDIEKYFKIVSNGTTTYTLKDDDSELVDGVYSYYIDFAECVVDKPGFQASQRVLNYDKERTKSGYSLSLIEK
jgi:hypothetical protein